MLLVPLPTLYGTRPYSVQYRTQYSNVKVATEYCQPVKTYTSYSPRTVLCVQASAYSISNYSDILYSIKIFFECFPVFYSRYQYSYQL